jgi:hypothetical protein
MKMKIEKIGEFFLRPDKIMGAFLITPETKPSGIETSHHLLERERRRDAEVKWYMMNIIKYYDYLI